MLSTVYSLYACRNNWFSFLLRPSILSLKNLKLLNIFPNKAELLSRGLTRVVAPDNCYSLPFSVLLTFSRIDMPVSILHKKKCIICNNTVLILWFQRFVSNPEVRKARHSTIAEYFIGRWAGQAIPYVGKDGKLFKFTQNKLLVLCLALELFYINR